MERYYMQIYRHTLSINEADVWIDINSLDIHPGMTEQLAEMGIVEINRGRIRASHLPRMQRVLRLRRNLGVNLPGAAIILELLGRIEEMQEEIERLKRR